MRKTSRFKLVLALLAGVQGAIAQSGEAFDCIVTPSRTVEVGSAVPGVLEKMLVDRSDMIEAGQVLARLDSRVEEATLEIARFRAEADTEVHLRKAAMEIDQRTQERLSSLAARKVASQQDRDRALRDARLSMWRARQAQDDQRLNRLEMLRAAANLEQRIIRSPIDGVVMARLRNVGEYVDDQPVLRVVKLDPLHIEAILPMNLFGSIEPGMTATVVPEFSGSDSYTASVDVIDPMGDPSSGTFGVRLVMQNPDAAIPAGLKCQVQFADTVSGRDGNGGKVDGYLPDLVKGSRLSHR